ncbi:MAG: hypothetical protein ACI4QR_03065, partial [Eubacteriales bacterium]
MTSKRNKKITSKRMPGEDIALYRMIILLVVGIIGFSLLASLGKASRLFLAQAQKYSVPFGILFIAAAIFLMIYKRKHKKTPDTAGIVTYKDISISLVILGVMLSLYPLFSDPIVKYQVAFVAIVILGFVKNLYTRGFFELAASICFFAFCIYFINADSATSFETFLSMLCKIIVFPVSAVMIVSACFLLSGNVKSEKYRRFLPENRFYAIVSVIIWIT